jgi:hypothetical protein
MPPGFTSTMDFPGQLQSLDLQMLGNKQIQQKGVKYLHDHHPTFMGESPGITWASLALTFFLLLSPATAKTDGNWWEQAPPPVVHGKVMPSCWWEKVKRSSERHHVNPFLVAAVAWIEGNGWRGDRIGHSPYWGPMGINEHCEKIPRWMIQDDLANIELGVCALRGKPKTALKRYNTKWFKNHYIRDVLALKRQLERNAELLVSLSGSSTSGDAL